MRYFDCTLRIKEEDIKSETVDMRELSYDSSIDALNVYMFRTLCNGVTFLVYRDEKSFLRAMLATESKLSDAMGEILSALDYLLGKKVDVSVPEEITLFDFDENMDEARRRGILRNWSRIADNANNLLYDIAEPRSGRRFVIFTEMLSGKPCKDHLFDDSFKDEEARIKASGKTGDETPIIGAHYEIAA
ncbi:MAG: hypothetical protein K5745_00510, partial [Saccharofermentans sp.]|nr:hypothetical protein [Saccharofermentans sp.]